MSDTTVVIATRNRRESLRRTLDRLAALPECPPLIVVDNGSTDGTAHTAAHHPAVHRLVQARRNLAAGARTLGAELAQTPYVAFSDDDSWWEAGALARATEVFSHHPRLGLLAARVLVEPGGHLDPTCARMAESPLPGGSALPGPRTLGFIACGAVVRREAFLCCGGFDARMGCGGEETLLAIDLTAAGWDVAYVDAVVARHAPAPGGRADRAMRLRCNELWTAWMRRPITTALVRTLHSGRWLLPALGGMPWALRNRRVVSAALERDLRLLEATASGTSDSPSA